MSKVGTRIFEVILGLALLLLFAASALAQEQVLSSQAGQISPTLRSAAYPEALYPHGIVPDWDRGYVLHYEIETNYTSDTPMVVMYDSTGMRIREGRIWPQGASNARIRRTAATRDGAILAAGGAIMHDGSIKGYIVKTDLAGRTVQTLLTGSFMPEQICEAPDGTIWSLGKSVNEDEGQHNTDVVRQYGFEKGLLHTFLPEDTVKAVVRSKRPWFSPFRSYVRCGSNKVSAYLNFTNEYVEIDNSSFELHRWKLDESVTQQRDANGLAITEDGRVYLGLGTTGRPGRPLARGLYQIKVVSGQPVARLLPVSGALSSLEPGDVPDPESFVLLWGADGNQLVVWRIGYGSMLSWVSVIQSDSTD
jgi:hypothetical protein